MSDIHIDYGNLIDDAMHAIVRSVLQRVLDEGLPGKHHFFISFLTQHPGVDISDNLREKYPDEMTIVIQHQYEDLTVNDTHFSVVLSFDAVKERILVPFSALTAFADPSVKFGLQFRPQDPEEDVEDRVKLLESQEEEKTSSERKPPKKPVKKLDNVVSIDMFRNNGNED